MPITSQAYAELGKLRAFFPPHIPIYATSATVPASTLQDITVSLGIDIANTFFLNLGNDRPNISFSVNRMNGAEDFAALKPHLFRTVGSLTPTTPDDLFKTFVFTNTVSSTLVGTRFIRSWLPKHLWKYVAFIHAHRSSRDKRRVMRRFRRGRIKILVATEAAEMVRFNLFMHLSFISCWQGANIPDIEQVIQFGVPTSLSVWMQRAGRAGRSRNINARAILLAEKSMFERRQVRRRKDARIDDASLSDSGNEEGDDEPEDEQADRPTLVGICEWKKKVDDALREWIETEDCRRIVADRYFGNPPNHQSMIPFTCSFRWLLTHAQVQLMLVVITAMVCQSQLTKTFLQHLFPPTMICQVVFRPHR